MSYQSHEPCTACGTSAVDVTYHHILTRKTRPDLKEAEFNKIPLCFTHHGEVHQIGMSAFAKRWGRVDKWLIKNGWEFDEFLRKWVNAKAQKIQE
jgi:hypothetical protein